MIDFKYIAAELLSRSESLLQSWLPDGKRVGHEWVSRNPNRSDENPGSFKTNLNTGVWQDFATGENGGDLISLWAYLESITQAEAAKQLSASEHMSAPVKLKKKDRAKWVATGTPGASEATPDDMQWSTRGEVEHWWAVRDLDNNVLYYDVRFKTTKKDGTHGKDILPLSWCRNTKTGSERWKYKSFPEPRPLFNHAAVAAMESHIPVLVVEGMKCAEKLATIVGDKFPVVTWQGGGKAVKKADWGPLFKRKVIIWPDNDAPGFDTAIDIAAILQSHGSPVLAINPHAEAPDAWDCADLIDAGADRKTVMQYLKHNRIKFSDFERLHRQQTELGDDEPPPGYEQTEFNPPDCEEWPFRVLGHYKENYYYLPKEKGQIVTLKMASHNKNWLLALAPIDWWEDNFPGGGKNKRGVCWTAAQDTLMRESHKTGPFHSSKQRGRGAWMDGKQIVIHVGDHLVVDSEIKDPVEFEGAYIYERGVRLAQGSNKPSSPSLGKQIIDLCKMFPWKSEVHGVLAAGWGFLSPICGALYWRPHIWITGEPGSGKTWFKSNAIEPFVRDFGVIAQGSTTAAGIRQVLGADALPVLFDEAESNDKRAAERIADVLELARQSSLSGDSAIIKGSAFGDFVSHAPASMWCMSSVVTAIRHQADQGRISILELCKYTPQVAKIKGRTLREQHRVTADLVAKLFTRENCHALRARAFHRLPVILQNVETFREQAADYFGNQRAGDQIGTLLAGAYCLASDGRVTASKAMAYIQSQDWTEVVKEDDHEEDHENLLRNIMQHIINITHPVEGMHRRTIAQTIDGSFTGNFETRECYRNALSTHGIHVGKSSIKKQIFISKKHVQIEKILMGTPWAVNYARTLLRIPGVVETNAKRIEYQPGQFKTTRLISMSADQFVGNDFDSEPEQKELTPQSDDVDWDKEIDF